MKGGTSSDDYLSDSEYGTLVNTMASDPEISGLTLRDFTQAGEVPGHAPSQSREDYRQTGVNLTLSDGDTGNLYIVYKGTQDGTEWQDNFWGLLEADTDSQRRAALCEDEHSIRAYFEKFLHADFSDPEVRGQVLEYFVDKIYVSETGLVITSWYSGDHGEVPWEVYFEKGGNPFDKGEAVKFDCFPFGSTTRTLILIQRFEYGLNPLGSAFYLVILGIRGV